MYCRLMNEKGFPDNILKFTQTILHYILHYILQYNLCCQVYIIKTANLFSTSRKKVDNFSNFAVYRIYLHMERKIWTTVFLF